MNVLHYGVLGTETGRAIAEHPGIRKIGFTGSTATGHAIMKASSESNLKKVSLELGGKSPLIIFDDCDLEKSVRMVCFFLSNSLKYFKNQLTMIYY